MRKVTKSIGLLALDVSSAVVLALGLILLSLPIVLHLTLGADNDAYIEIGELGGAKPNVLGYLGLEWMFRIDFLLWPALLIIMGLGLRELLWILLTRRAIPNSSDSTHPRHASSTRCWMLAGFVALCVLALVFAVLFAYWGRQWQALQSKPAYPSPEEAMRAFLREHYMGLQEVKIVRAALESPLLNNLCFVEARVWAERRADGRMVSAEGDNPACFFLHTDRGWVLVPESVHPELLAIGRRLFH